MTVSLDRVRKASESDIPFIKRLSVPWEQESVLLVRTEKQIRNDLPLTWVYEDDAGIRGSMALVFFSPQLCEIRGLVVDKDVQGKSIGRRMISDALGQLQSSSRIFPIRVFALTYVPDFFVRLGFRITDKQSFPEKVYEVCHFCAKQHDCREIAVERIIESVRGD